MPGCQSCGLLGQPDSVLGTELAVGPAGTACRGASLLGCMLTDQRRLPCLLGLQAIQELEAKFQFLRGIYRAHSKGAACI